MTPLLSPALSNQQSHHASPANSMAFSQHSASNPSKSPLEQLQEQQRQFQEQLALLQQQQRELQATAAAVAAASSSNYASAPGSAATSPYVTAQNPRPATTPGVNGTHSSGSLNTPSPGYFSPLTSPALESRGHFSQHQQHQYNRPPHPLSALSSPALNPVGSSGGAQQTLSPALEPQSNADMADPDHVRALVGMLDNAGQNGQQGDPLSQIYHSPALGPQQHQSSPLVGPVGAGTGPHRQSLPSKTRPSPMMKPINHRSHGKHASTSGGANFTIPTSPAIQRVVQSGVGVPGMGYLPPAAIQPHYSSGSNTGTSTGQSAFSHSAPSTPSPVDLNQLMPPPPVPANANKMKSMAPMTPASLMNLGPGVEPAVIPREEPESGQATPVAPLKRQGGRASNGNAEVQTKTQSKRGAATASTSARKGASRLAPTAAGKRALAMRPAGDVGVRAGE